MTFFVTISHSLASVTASHGRRALRSAGVSSVGYWQLGTLFVALYLAVERATFAYQLDGLGITLWSPSAGLSLALLMTAGISYAPFVLAASLITDYAVYSGPRGWVAPIATSLVLTGGLVALALVLKTRLHLARPRLSHVWILLAVVPSGTLIIALAYCLVLYVTDQLSSWSFDRAVRNFWIGDTLGIITVLPVAATVFASVSRASRQAIRHGVIEVAFFSMALAAALWVIFGLKTASEAQFFYLLFLPIVWTAARHGFAGVAIALLSTHVALIAVVTVQGYAAPDFIAFQMLMLVLSVTGLLLGAAVTESRASEERLRDQRSELARAARHALVGATGTALAHEISQPLSSATNYLHAASRMLQAQPHADPSIAEALAKARSEAQRARETLQRVRDYVSCGRLALSSVDVEALTARIVSLIGAEAGSRGVEIRVSSAPHLPNIQGDAIQLEQLLLNLISNAIDAAAQGAKAQGRVAVHLVQQRDRIVVSVDDNGPGIAEHIADRLFEPFETTKQSGMGLGLALARQIVEAHTGELRVENRAAQGARFSVALNIDGPRRRHGN